MKIVRIVLTLVSITAAMRAQTWAPLSAVGGPPSPRAFSSAVFDATGQRMIVFGGQSTGGLGDTWALTTGTSPQWTLVNSGGNGPRPRFGHTAVYDARNSRMIVFAGGVGTPTPCLNDVWVLANATGTSASLAWSPVQTSGGSPPARVFHTAVYDPNSNRMIVFGGRDCSANGSFLNDLWILSNIGTPGAVPTWTLTQSGGTPPPAREQHTAVYDASANRMIVFGGDAGTTDMNDIWVLSNANGVNGPPVWSQVAPGGTPPSPRSGSTAVWDTGLLRMILFGGNGGGAALNDTFAVSGFGSPFAPPTWAQLSDNKISPRAGAASIFDAGSNRMIVFGGSGPNGPQNDTWVLNLSQQQTQPVTITTTSVPNGTVGVAYSAQLAAANGTPPYGGWVVAGGSLPPGLTLNTATGVIGGSPTASGSFSFTVTVKDSAGVTSSPQALTITIPATAALTISITSLPAGTAGIPYSAQLAAAGGTPPYGNWIVTTGALPPGLTLNISTGAISGTPTTAAGSPFSFSVTVRDNASGTSPAQPLSITIVSGITITPASLPGGTVGVPYSVQLTAANGVAPYSNWQVSSGALPAGLSLNSTTGVIGGTPTAVTGGAFNFNVTVQDARGSTSTPQALSIVIVSAVTITTTSLPGGSVSGPYSAQLTAAGGTSPYTNWLVVTGTLPGGLTLSPTSGAILGIPLIAGTFTFSVTVKDYAGVVSAPQPFSIVIVPRVNITTAMLPGATVGTAYSAQLTAADGIPPYSNWALSSGALPAGLNLNAATGVISGIPASSAGSPVTFSITVKDSAGGSSLPQSLSISFGPPPAIVTAPASLTFSYRLGDPAPAPQSVSVFSGGAFTASARSDQNFLTVTPATGQTPAAINVAINTTGLRAGTFTGQVVIALAASPSSASTVQVTLNVDAPAGPQLQLSPPQFSITAVQSAPAAHLQLAVLNTGSGTLNFTARLRFFSGANWASLDSSAGAATFAAPGSVGITINSAALNPGIYQAEVSVLDQASNQSQTCAIILSVTARSLSIQLSQAGLQFTAAAGGAASPAQQFGIGNTGQGQMNWTASAQTLSGADGWLIATPAAGISTAGAASTPAVTVSINAARLPPGRYFGTVRITAPGAANSPQVVSVVLDVVDAAQAPAPVPSDAGVLVVGDSSVPSPAASQISIANLSGKALTYLSTSSTEDGRNWITLSPPAGTLAPGSTSIGVQPNFAGLAPGVRRGAVRLGFADGSVRTIGVTSVLPSTGATITGKDLSRAAGNCTPKALVPAFLSLEPGFTVTGSSPVSLRLLVVDDCGTPLQTSAGVFVRFSNDSRTLSLNHTGNGNWSGTWVPANVNAAVGIVATAFSAGASALGGQTPILQGTVRSTTSPLARATSIYNSASFQPGDQVAVGSWASLFGDGLADGETQAPGAPYGPQLGSTEVRLGDIPLPLLYVNPTQVNALIPRNLEPNTQHQIVVQRGASVSVPVQVTVADVQPGIYSVNQQGTGQGAVLIGNTAVLVAPAAPGARPAARGETISIFCTGLGEVTGAPADGVPAPLDSLAPTLAIPTVTMGGASAPVGFSGLAPGLAGVYQVNAMVPDEAPSGDAVELIVTLNGVPSNTVTMAIQ